MQVLILGSIYDMELKSHDSVKHFLITLAPFLCNLVYDCLRHCGSSPQILPPFSKNQAPQYLLFVQSLFISRSNKVTDKLENLSKNIEDIMPKFEDQQPSTSCEASTSQGSCKPRGGEGGGGGGEMGSTDSPKKKNKKKKKKKKKNGERYCDFFYSNICNISCNIANKRIFGTCYASSLGT